MPRQYHINPCLIAYAPHDSQYGFTKVRRGPETDMYAHPSFLRARPETLMGLRKITNPSRKRLEVSTVDSVDTIPSTTANVCRPVSPSTPSTGCETPGESPTSDHQILMSKLPKDTVDLWPPVKPFQLTKQLDSSYHNPSPVRCVVPVNSQDRGKLDLLALAMERTSAFTSA
jgi:hypothetical protein